MAEVPVFNCACAHDTNVETGAAAHLYSWLADLQGSNPLHALPADQYNECLPRWYRAPSLCCLSTTQATPHLGAQNIGKSCDVQTVPET